MKKYYPNFERSGSTPPINILLTSRYRENIPQIKFERNGEYLNFFEHFKKMFKKQGLDFASFNIPALSAYCAEGGGFDSVEAWGANPFDFRNMTITVPEAKQMAEFFNAIGRVDFIPYYDFTTETITQGVGTLLLLARNEKGITPGNYWWWYNNVRDKVDLLSQLKKSWANSDWNLGRQSYEKILSNLDLTKKELWNIALYWNGEEGDAAKKVLNISETEFAVIGKKRQKRYFQKIKRDRFYISKLARLRNIKITNNEVLSVVMSDEYSYRLKKNTFNLSYGCIETELIKLENHGLIPHETSVGYVFVGADFILHKNKSKINLVSVKHKNDLNYCLIGNNYFCFKGYNFAKHGEGQTLKEAHVSFLINSTKLDAQMSHLQEHGISFGDINDIYGTVRRYCINGVKTFLQREMPFIGSLLSKYQTWGEVPQELMTQRFKLAPKYLKRAIK